jgi:pimeloyl-ACP methyl ester carboxylesterase
MNQRAVPPMQPLLFGPQQRRLFGVFHARETGSEPRLPVLVCSPFFQEAISAHRFQRVLADRLGRNGHAVLRFDYFGTGDSPGDDLDVDLDGSVGDVVVAIGELLRQTGARRCVVIGISLGGNVALRAAARVPNDVSRLVLVQPVVDGATYLAELPISRLNTPDQQSAAAGGRTQRFEAAGFAMSPKFLSQIRTLASASEPWTHGSEFITYLAETSTATGDEVPVRPAGFPDRYDFVPIARESNWNSETADGVPLVPPLLLAELLRQAMLA